MKNICLLKIRNVGGPHITMVSVLASHPAAPGSILGVPKIFSEKFEYKNLDVIEIYRLHSVWTVHTMLNS